MVLLMLRVTFGNGLFIFMVQICFRMQELVNTQQLPSMLESTLQKLKQVSEKYSSKSALGKSPAVVEWQ